MTPAQRWMSALVMTCGGVAAACSTSGTATTYTPYTGIDIPTAAVTAGIGCATGDSDGGIDHYVAFLAYASEAGAPAEVAPSTLVAAGSFACFTPNGVFENVDAAATFDVWIFAYAAGLPSDLPCDAGTCALSPASAWQSVQATEVDGGESPILVLRCSATGQAGVHPAAYGCERVGPGAPADAGDAGAD